MRMKTEKVIEHCFASTREILVKQESRPLCPSSPIRPHTILICIPFSIVLHFQIALIYIFIVFTVIKWNFVIFHSVDCFVGSFSDVIHAFSKGDWYNALYNLGLTIISTHRKVPVKIGEPC